MKTTVTLILLFAAAAIAQERRRAVDPPPSSDPGDDREIGLALGPAASNIVSTVRCTLVDTRLAAGPFGGPRFTAGETRSYVVPNGPCSGIPVALGYGLTFTAIAPDADNVPLKAWNTGAIIPPLFPTVILSRGTAPNATDTTARTVAIAPNLSGSINVKVDVGTDLLIQLSAYYTAGLVINTTPTDPLSGGGTGNISIGILDGAIGDAKLSSTPTNSNTPGKIVLRDATGGFSDPHQTRCASGNELAIQR